MITEPSEELVDHRLHQLFGESSPIEISRISHRIRNGVRVDRLVIEREEGPLRLVVKHYFGPLESGQGTRPRLGLADDRQAKPSLEYAGLQRLYEHRYPDMSKARAVRPFHYDEGERLLIMGEFPGTSVRDAFQGDLDVLRNALRAGGETLAHAHAMPHDGQTRRQKAADVEEDLVTLLRFVREKRDTRLHRQLEGWWREQELKDGTCGPGHGDCSARNLLVSEHGEVAWIDGLFRYAVPVYEDLATFTTSTRTTLRMFRRNGLTSRARSALSNEFVLGYGQVSDVVDPSILARFEALVLLDRQASLLTSPRSIQSRLLLQLTDRELHANVRKNS